MQYAIRLPANRSLELEIEDILFRPPGRPGRKPLVRYKSFRYQAEGFSPVFRGRRTLLGRQVHLAGGWDRPVEPRVDRQRFCRTRSSTRAFGPAKCVLLLAAPLAPRLS